MGRSLGERNGYPLQYSCLEKPWAEEPGGYSLWGRKESDMTDHSRRDALEIAKSVIPKPTLPENTVNHQPDLINPMDDPTAVGDPF